MEYLRMLRLSRLISQSRLISPIRKFSNIRQPPWSNNYQNNNKVVYGIILANVGVYAAWHESDRDYSLRKLLNNHFMLSNQAIKKGYYHTLVTSFFSHKDLFHLGFNMLTFYTFGNFVISSLGVRNFLLLYGIGGIFSSVTFLLEPYYMPRTWGSYSFNKNMFGDRRALGASGAVSAIVYYSILMNPAQTILVFFVPMPAVAALLLFFSYDVYGMYKGDGAVGHSSHLAGAFIGTSYFLFRRIRRL